MNKKRSNNGFLSAALALAVLVLTLTAWLLLRGPMVSASVNTLDKNAQSVLSALNRGDLELCGSLLYGSPDLGPVPQADTPQRIVWEGYIHALSWAPDTAFHMEGDEACLNVTMTVLDMADFWSRMEAEVPGIAEEMAKGREAGQMYNTEGSWQPEFSQAVLSEAARQILPQTAVVQRELPLHFALDRGVWRVIPTDSFCQLLLCC